MNARILDTGGFMCLSNMQVRETLSQIIQHFNGYAKCHEEKDLTIQLCMVRTSVSLVFSSDNHVHNNVHIYVCTTYN